MAASVNGARDAISGDGGERRRRNDRDGSGGADRQRIRCCSIRGAGIHGPSLAGKRVERLESTTNTPELLPPAAADLAWQTSENKRLKTTAQNSPHRFQNIGFGRTDREHITEIGGRHGRGIETVHDDLESAFTLGGIRTAPHSRRPQQTSPASRSLGRLVLVAARPTINSLALRALAQPLAPRHQRRGYPLLLGAVAQSSIGHVVLSMLFAQPSQWIHPVRSSICSATRQQRRAEKHRSITTDF